MVVSIMPCTAKKYECARPELAVEGEKDVDVVITTKELASMIKEAGIVFSELESEAPDMPFGLASGSGVLFGVTGGVAEAVLRRCVKERTQESLKELAFSGVRGMEGIKEAQVKIGEKTLSLAVVHGLRNVETLLEMIKKGEKHYDFVEVMACQGGCIGGAGQPIPIRTTTKKSRAMGIYNADKLSQIKRSEENPMIIALYNGILKGKTHKLLHCRHNHQD
jgi:NADH-quinone oxidoreductase subunit G